MRYRHFLVSFSGEIGVKAPGTRRALEDLTVENLRRRAGALGISLRIERFAGRLLVEAPSEAERLLLTQAGLGRVAEFLEPSERDLLSPGFWEDRLPVRPFTYVVYVDRVKPRERFSEILEIKRRLLKILEEFSRKRLALWDNHPPERLEIRLEADGERLFLLCNPRSGLSGLPVGAGEKVLLLFSGGPDSLLSAVRLAARGQEVALVFFDDGEEGRAEAVRRVAETLAYFFPAMTSEFFRIPYREVLEFLTSRVPRRERCFFCKATMLRLAAELARREDFSAVATGEILGEQASQTLPALRFTTEVAEVLVLRPVLTHRKEEIFQELEKLGLGEVARLSLPACPFAPDHPHTRPVSSPGALIRIWPEIKKRVKTPEKEIVSYGGR